MADLFKPYERSAIMQNIKSKDSPPEKHLRSLVHQMGYRFRLHRRDLPGTPDIVLPRHRKVIFMHSCFFHGHKGCRRDTMPATRREFWQNKIEGNAKRGKASYKKLKQQGWDYLVVWQCELKKINAYKLKAKIQIFMEQ